MYDHARFEPFVVDTLGNGVPSQSVEVRRPGATVKNNQTVTSGTAINVDDVGGIKQNDVVIIVTRTGTVGSTQYSVTGVDVTNKTVTLSGYGGSLVLSDEDRLSPVNDLPALFNDIAGNESTSNPLTTGNDGLSNTDSKGAWVRMGGLIDYVISGPGVNSRLVRDHAMRSADPVFYADDAMWGLAGDGVTDDAPALQRVLDRASVANAYGPLSDGVIRGGAVQLGRKSYMLNSEVTLPNNVSLRGISDRTTILFAGAGFTFSGTNAMLRIGAAGVDTYHCRIENMHLDCRDIANSIGIRSTSCQEHSGVYRCLISKYANKGVYFSTSGCQNFILSGLNLAPSVVAGGTKYGIYVDGASGPCAISDVTVNPFDGSTLTTGAGIYVANGGIWDIGPRINVEDHQYGVQVSGSASGIIKSVNISTPAGPTSAVRIESAGWLVMGCSQGGATNLIQDTLNGITYSGNAGQWYWLSNDGGVGQKSRFSSDADASSILQSPTTFVNGLTSSGTFTASSNVDITGRIRAMTPVTRTTAGTITVAKSFVRLDGAATLTTINIDGITPNSTHDGYMLYVAAVNGNVTVTNAGNIIDNCTINTNTARLFIYDHTSLKWRFTG